jgi:hypothetical protein
MLIFGGMNNNNYLGSSMFTIVLDSLIYNYIHTHKVIKDSMLLPKDVIENYENRKIVEDYEKRRRSLQKGTIKMNTNKSLPHIKKQHD